MTGTGIEDKEISDHESHEQERNLKKLPTAWLIIRSIYTPPPHPTRDALIVDEDLKIKAFV